MLENVHDNEIVSYNVDFKKNTILFNTINFENDIITITFQGVLVHLFELEMPNSIILDIEKMNIEDMINENEELLEKTKNYCWPMLYNNIDELVNKLKINKYNYYVISSSSGLCGWIIAKELIINTDN